MSWIEGLLRHASGARCKRSLLHLLATVSGKHQNWNGLRSRFDFMRSNFRDDFYAAEVRQIEVNDYPIDLFVSVDECLDCAGAGADRRDITPTAFQYFLGQKSVYFVVFGQQDVEPLLRRTGSKCSLLH